MLRRLIHPHHELGVQTGTEIPVDAHWDNTMALLREGYTFAGKRFQRHHTDIFQTRLMLRKAVMVVGEDAARMFYAPGRLTRRGAMPITTLALLQDNGSVQLLDGEAHRLRKQIFMGLMDPASRAQLIQSFAQEWVAALAEWERLGHVVLHDEVCRILCRAVCHWAGVPLTDAEAWQRTREFRAMIDGAGSVGPRNWWGMLQRSRTELWGRGLIDAARTGERHPPENSALYAFAWHRDAGGHWLSAASAAVELLNVLRPTVAVAWYITFAALALHQFPSHRRALAEREPEALECFAQEVRELCSKVVAEGC